MEYIWKCLLTAYSLDEEDKNRFVPIVSTYGKTMHNADIAALIVDEGTEYKFEAILEILSRRDRIVREGIGRGESIQDENFHFGPYIGGTVDGSDSKFEPGKNRIMVKVTPTAKLRKLFQTIKVEILGIKGSKSRLGRIVDIESGKTDSVVTPEGDIFITGVNLQVDPIDDPAMGIFFTNVSTSEAYRVTRKLSVNKPSSIRTRAPMLPDGTYELKIVTRYAGRKGALLKTPRVLTLGVKLTVGNVVRTPPAETTQNPPVETVQNPPVETEQKPTVETEQKPPLNIP